MAAGTAHAGKRLVKGKKKMKSLSSILEEILITEARMPYTVSPDGQVIISLDFKLKKGKIGDVDMGDEAKLVKMTPEQQLEWYFFDVQDMVTVKDFKYDKKANTVTVNTKKPDKANERPEVEVDEFVNGLKRQLKSDSHFEKSLKIFGRKLPI